MGEGSEFYAECIYTNSSAGGTSSGYYVTSTQQAYDLDDPNILKLYKQQIERKEERQLSKIDLLMEI